MHHGKIRLDRERLAEIAAAAKRYDDILKIIAESNTDPTKQQLRQIDEEKTNMLIHLRKMYGMYVV